jgi:hypothetical protein
MRNAAKLSLLFGIGTILAEDDKVSKRKTKTVIAAVLLVLECLALLLFGILCSKMDSVRIRGDVSAPRGMHLTLNKDISFNQYGIHYYYPAGTVFEPFRFSADDSVGCYLPMDEIEDYEPGFSEVAWFTTDIFEEQDRIREQVDEAIKVQNELRQEDYSQGIKTTVIITVCWLVLGAVLVLILSKNDTYCMLYILEIVILLTTIVFYIVVAMNPY